MTLEEAYEKHDREFSQRACLIAERDGIPPKGSDEIRLHAPLKGDRYITTEKVMVSFRSPRGIALSLLEVLYADGEGTHITGRDAIVVDPQTGHVFDQGLFFQSRAGSFTSVLAMAEIKLNELRKKSNWEKRNQKEDPNKTHLFPYVQDRMAKISSLVDRFKAAGQAMGIEPSSQGLSSNRHLFRIPNQLWIVDSPPSV